MRNYWLYITLYSSNLIAFYSTIVSLIFHKNHTILVDIQMPTLQIRPIDLQFAMSLSSVCVEFSFDVRLF